MSTTAFNIHGATGPDTNKDLRSFRPRSMAEMHILEDYHPLEIKLWGEYYLPIGLGNSCKDLLIIVMCYVTLYSIFVGVFVLLLTITVKLSNNSMTGSNTILWLYFCIGVFFTGLIIMNVYVTQLELKHERENFAQQAEERLRDVVFTVPVTPADGFEV